MKHYWERRWQMSNEIDYRVAIQRNYKELGTKKRRIADYVLANPMQVVSSSVQALAASCECEQTTIVRFAQQLGFSGYSDMKIAIARQTNSVWAEYASNSEKGVESILMKLSKRHAASIQETLAMLDETLLNRLCGMIEKASRILVFGTGTSQLAAMDLNIKLLRLGIQSNFFPDVEMTRTFLGHTRDNGIVFLFSNSGETEIIVELAKIAKREEIPVVAITSFQESSLAQEAAYTLLTACRNEPTIRFGVMSARIAQLAVVDALTLLYSMRDRSRSLDNIAKGYHEDN